MQDADVGPFQHERKFLLKREQAEAFIGAVSPHLVLDVYDVTRPVAFTRTTYLDTADRSYLRSCDGPVARRLRIREYAAAADIESPPLLSGICYLEMKESTGPIRSKARFAAPPGVLSQVLEGAAPDIGWSTRLDQLQPFQGVWQMLRDGLLRPTLTTFYRRASLTGEGGRVRVTLDEGIAFCEPEGVGEMGTPATPRTVVNYGPGRLLEVKYLGEPPHWLRSAMEGLPESPGFSKFQIGSLMLTHAGLDGSARSTRPIPILSPMRVKK